MERDVSSHEQKMTKMKIYFKLLNISLKQKKLQN